MKSGKGKRTAEARGHCANYLPDGSCLGMPSSMLLDHGQTKWMCKPLEKCKHAQGAECNYFKNVVRL